MMTIDEAIEHCERVARDQQSRSEWLMKIYTALDVETAHAELCMECAKEHRQLAEWLRELKAYKQQAEKV